MSSYSQQLFRFLLLLIIILFGVVSTHINASEPWSVQSEWHTGRKTSWSDHIWLNSVNDMAITSDGHVYLACTNSTLLASKERGDEWREKTLALHGDISRVTANDTGVIIAWNRAEYALSFDHGENWTSTALTQEDVIWEVGLSRTDSIVWIVMYTEPSPSARGKVTFRSISGTGIEDFQIKALFDRIQPIDSINGWARYADSFFTTDDGGRTWVKRNAIPLSGNETIRTTEQAEDGPVVATSSGRFLKYSLNSGWTELSSLPRRATLGPDSVYFTAPNQIYALSRTNEVFFSSDLHSDWVSIGTLDSSVEQFAAWTPPRFIVRYRRGSIAVFEPTWPNARTAREVPAGEPYNIAISNTGIISLTTDSGDIASSSDDGRTWTLTASNSSPFPGPLAIADDGWGILVTNENTLWTTNSGGATWTSFRQLSDSSVTRVTVASGQNAIVEVKSGPIWEPAYHLYRITPRNAWQEIPNIPNLALLRFITSDILASIELDGVVRKSRDGGQSWDMISTDIQAWIAGHRPSGTEFTEMFWLDNQRAWIAASDVLFFTKNGGYTWQPFIDLPTKDANITEIYFYDSDAGLIYDKEHNAIYETRDGGETWRHPATPDLSGRAVRAVAFARSGRGVLASSTGITFIKENPKGRPIRATAELLSFGGIRLMLRADNGRLEKGAYKDIALLVEAGTNHWVNMPISSSIRDVPGGIIIEWAPNKQLANFEAPGWLAQKLHLTDRQDIFTTVTIPSLYYFPWFEQNKVIIYIIGGALLALLLAIVYPFILYFIAPRQIVSISYAYTYLLSHLKGTRYEIILTFTEWILLRRLVAKLASRASVAHAWLRAYDRGKVKFKDINDLVFDVFCANEVVLDWWAGKHLTGCLRFFNAQMTELEAAEVYIPLPIRAKLTSGNEELVIFPPNVSSIRPLLSSASLVIGIVSSGGTGKTTLARQIGVWAMETDSNRRLFGEHTSIAVLVRAGAVDFFGEIMTALNSGFRDDSDLRIHDTAIVKAALRSRRLILITDGISELGGGSAQWLHELLDSTLPSIFVFTSRRTVSTFTPQYLEVNTLELVSGDLNRFMSQYLSINFYNRLSARDELILLTGLIDLLERRASKHSLPVVFVKLLLDSYDQKREIGHGKLPISLAETVQGFVLGTKLSEQTHPDEPYKLVQAAARIAQLCMAPDLHPGFANYEDALNVLEPVFRDQSRKISVNLLEGGILVRDVSLAGERVSFRIGIVAEYLAAIAWIKELDGDELLWARHLSPLEASPDALQKASGYIDALLECVPWMKTTFPIAVPVGLEAKLHALATRLGAETAYSGAPFTKEMP